MKKIIFTSCLCICVIGSIAQNVGIGTPEPTNKLHINGNLLVNTPSSATSTSPAVAQTKTLVNAATISFAATDSTGRIYDPGGPSGNYNANTLANAFIDYNFPGCFGIEITVESMQLGTGDSLFISESQGSVTLLAVGNNYTTTGKWIFNSPLGSLYIIFKSNADASVGNGFSMLFRRLYDNSQSLPDVNNYAGKALFFDTKSGAFRSGLISNPAKGYYSTAMGEFPIASGYSSTAIGSFTTATGDYSVAVGQSAKAEGNTSTALGKNTDAAGDYSTAAGYFSAAQGSYSTAIGYTTIASGAAASAIGYNTVASGVASMALGQSTNASGPSSLALGYNTNASGNTSTAMGNTTIASGSLSTAIGYQNTSRGFAGTALGMYNNPVLASPQTVVTSTTPLFIIGNGDLGNLSNAMVVLKSGNTGIGTDAPLANLHIRHGSSGGLMLENSADGNKWRLYSASGDNNLTFFNNANVEVADIDDVTGAYTAISDIRLKKDIQPMKPVLPLLMQLSPSYYHFNWQQSKEQVQIGMMAQETYKLFPELVSYNEANDIYKMNYAGFSTVAIKAIQEQQLVIENLQKQIDELNILVKKLLEKK